MLLYMQIIFASQNLEFCLTRCFRWHSCATTEAWTSVLRSQRKDWNLTILRLREIRI